MQNKINHCGIVVIAAGQSKRLGSPKQLLTYEGKTLLNRLLDMVKQAGDFETVVVLGAAAETIQQQMEDTNCTIVVNQQWEEGMASSIKIGLATLLQQYPTMDGVMLLVCDQPFINAQTIQSLLQLQAQTELPIAAAYYAHVLGTPALFHHSFFAQLFALTGDVGAKYIIQQQQDRVAALHFEKGLLDIDTPEDYAQLLRQATNSAFE